MRGPAFALLLLALVAGAALARQSGPAVGDSPVRSPRSNYLERCGGCHGVDGRAFAVTVPDLKGRAGWFLCDASGRDYVARLPNVAFTHLDDTQLAAMLNYVVFDLGGAAQTRSAAPFTPAEVGRERRRALTIPDLDGYRARVVARLIGRCGAPDGLASDYVISREAPAPGG